MVGRIIDISANNEHPINWAAVARAGVTTAIIKATEGTTYTNPDFHGDMTGANLAGIDVLAYHYAGMGNPTAEAAYFVSVATTRYARILDIETSQNTAWTRAFLMALGNPSGELMTYGSASTIGSIRAQIPSTIWVAAYEQNYPGYGVMWQFTSSAEIPGITGLVDESSWHGTELQYETLFGLDAPPDPIPSQPNPEEAENVTSWTAGGQNHVAGVINGVAYHWWQTTPGTPGADLTWHVEQLPT
jgi:GH25 family lysozyme M1 (1,4-beta-N-acetylmuramidase)